MALFMVFCVSIWALEMIDWRIKDMNGLRADNRSAVLALHYVPTITMILVGFAWKGVTSDICMLTPWAVISGKWAKAKDSILLNYVDTLDVVSVYTAAQHGHWTLSVVIACGFLTGVSVALANALAQATIGAGLQTAQSLNTADRFVINNGTLAVPLGWKNNLPYLQWDSYVGSTTNSGRFPWLINSYAFSALDTIGFSDDTILSATVNTFSASLECVPITYSGTYSQSGYNSSLTLEGDGFKGCNLPISQSILWPFNSSSILKYPVNNASATFDIPPISWSNVTACNAEGDFRLLATNMILKIDKNLISPYVTNGTKTLYNSTNVWSKNSIEFKASGFVCSARYWSTPADIAVDVSSKLVSKNFNLHQDEVEELPGVGVGLDFLQAQLNNPYAVSSRKVFQAAATNNETSQRADSYDWSQFSKLKVMQKYAYLYLLNDASEYNQSTRSLRDPFLNSLVSSSQNTWELANNATLFQQRLSSAFAQFTAALVSASARDVFQEPIDGRVFRPGTYFKIRQAVLRSLELILAILALVTLVVLVHGRPRTYLTQHPGSLDQMAMLIADSPEIDGVFEGIDPYRHESLLRNLSDFYCRLSWSEGRNLQLELRREEEIKPGSSAKGQTFEMRKFKLQPSVHRYTTPRDSAFPEGSTQSHSKVHRHRPLGLRFGSRVGIILSLTGIVIATTVLCVVSDQRGGFSAPNSTMPAAFSLVSTLLPLSSQSELNFPFYSLKLTWNYRSPQLY